MADPRFFDRLGPLSLQEIAALSGAAISDSGQGGHQVSSAVPIREGTPGALSYADNALALGDGSLQGVAVIVTDALANTAAGLGAIILTHSAPRTAFARALAALAAPRSAASTQRIHETAEIAPDAVIAATASIGPDARIADRVRIGPGSVIGPGCHIGAGTIIGANVTVLCSDIGADCNILSGAVIGEAGFGIAVSDSGTIDIPHMGQVEIADKVTIGANSCVDRGLFGPTRIGEGTKIDNLCHIGHNCTVGRNVVMAAYGGISGSCVIEDGVMMGGRVGTHDHITLHAGARIGGNSAVSRNVPAGETWLGSPAQPIENEMRQIAALRRLMRATRKKK